MLLNVFNHYDVMYMPVHLCLRLHHDDLMAGNQIGIRDAVLKYIIIDYWMYILSGNCENV